MITVAAKLPGAAPVRTRATLTRDGSRTPRAAGVRNETAHRPEQRHVSHKGRAFSAAMYDYCLTPKYWDAF
jgi:hypothetical protein